MVGTLALAALAYRTGLAMRRARRGRGRRTKEMRELHMRLAKPTVALVLVGFVLGPASTVWLRGWEAFDTFHALLGVLSAGLFVGAAVMGHRIETGQSKEFDTHALLGALAWLLAAVGSVAGFVLLP